MKAMMELMEDYPIILGVRSQGDVALALENESKVVFTLFGDAADISDIVAQLKAGGKTVFVNIDMVDGFAARNSVVKFIKEKTLADGIVSTKAAQIRYAKEQGLATVHRFFVVDSQSYRSIESQVRKSQPHFINIVPGWTKVIEWTVEQFSVPVIAAGLVCDKQTVMDSLKAGAIAICSTNHDVWEI